MAKKDKIGGLGAHIGYFCSLALFGFPFLLWTSSAYLWFLSLFVTFTFALISWLLEKNNIFYYEELDGQNAELFNPFMNLAIVLAALIFFSGPFTDNQTYCEKQINTTWTPTLSYSSGQYRVKDKMSTSYGRGGCAPGWGGIIYITFFFGATVWFFAHTLIMFYRYFFSKK